VTTLSIIVPAYNEAKRIAPTLQSILDFAAIRSDSAEVIVVDDGSTDGTAGVCRTIGGSSMRLLRTTRNKGKGHAVRTGMLAATGEYRLFTDADGSTPIEEIGHLERALMRIGNSGVAFGSIGVPEARVNRPQMVLRSMAGRLGNLVIRAAALPRVQDSQRGFKLFSADAAVTIFERCVVDGWGFDVEALVLARRLGFPIVEVPISWAHVDGGTITPLAYASTMRDVARIRWRLMRRAYD
jgi:dolichyl-phosphate beta-glucosyltransferase